MKSIEDRLDEVKDDPDKLKRAFTTICTVSYAMLMIGVFLIVAILAYAYLF